MRKSNIFDAAERRRQLEKARAMSEAEINVNAPDSRPMSEEKWAGARPFREMFRPVKKLISLRLDADVLTWYQRQGEGYQTRMNQALRAQMEAEQRVATKR